MPMRSRHSDDTGAPRRHGVLMLLENESYPDDTRVRLEAEALVGAGHRVRVLAPRLGKQARRERVADVSVRRFWRPLSKHGFAGYVVEYLVAHVQLLTRAIAAAIRGDVTVIHAHNPPDSLALGAALAKPFKKKIVYDCHDLAPELFEVMFSSRAVAALLRATQRAAVRLADAVIVTNESQRELLASHTSSPEKIHIVRNGPPRDVLKQAVPGRAGRLADPRLVYLGTLAEQDGVVELADVLARVRDHAECRDATLLVVGDGRCRSTLEERIVSLGLSQACRFTGRVAQREVPGLLAEADICVDPAPCTPLNVRSTMVKIGEYLAAGRPVVAFDLLETRRTAEAATVYAPCGDFDAFASCIVSLASDPELRAACELRARDRVEALLWEHSERKLLEVYERL